MPNPPACYLAPTAIRLAMLLCCAVGCLSGCFVVDSGLAITQESILQAAQPSDDAVTLDIYWVRLPPHPSGQEEADRELWDQISEEGLPIELRRRLASNGLRAGVVSTAAPDALLKLIDPEGGGDASSDGQAQLTDTGVRRRTRQMRPGQSIELNASKVLDEAPLLVARDGQLTGKTFRQVQGVYVLEVDRTDDDRIEVSLAPEVRHGDQLLRFVSDETGAFTRGALAKEAESFVDLTIAAPLSAGEMLLVTNLPHSGSRLGGLFHEPDGDRKAILIRVASAPASREFLPEER